jgi:hypothetical protein
MPAAAGAAVATPVRECCYCRCHRLQRASAGRRCWSRRCSSRLDLARAQCGIPRPSSLCRGAAPPHRTWRWWHRSHRGTCGGGLGSTAPQPRAACRAGLSARGRRAAGTGGAGGADETPAGVTHRRPDRVCLQVRHMCGGANICLQTQHGVGLVQVACLLVAALVLRPSNS